MATQTGIVNDAPYISLHQEGLAFKQYQVLLLPYEGKGGPEVVITPLVTDEADRVHRQNIGYEIDILGRTDLFLESGNSMVRVTFGEYEFRGDVAHINDAANPEAHYLFLNSDHFAHNGKLLFSAPAVMEAIEFTIGNPPGQDALVLEIVTESDISGVRIFAPGVKNVTVNRVQKRFTKEGDYIIMD